MSPHFRLAAIFFIFCLMTVWTVCGCGNDNDDDSNDDDSGDNPTDDDLDGDADDDAVDDDATGDDTMDDTVDDDSTDDDTADDDTIIDDTSDDDSNDDTSDDSGDDTTDDDTTVDWDICEVMETTPEGWQYCHVIQDSTTEFEMDSVMDAFDVLHAVIVASGTKIIYLKDDHGTWYREDIETDSSIRGPSIDVGPSGTIYIAYSDTAAHEIRLSTFENGVWTTQDGVPCTHWTIVAAGDEGTVDVVCNGNVATLENGIWSQVTVMSVESYYQVGAHRDVAGDLHMCGGTGSWLRHGKRSGGQWTVEVVDNEAMQNCNLATDGNGVTYILSWDDNVGAAYWYENSSGAWTKMVLSGQALRVVSDLRVAQDDSIIFAAIKLGGYVGDPDGLLLYRYHNNFMDRVKLTESFGAPLTMDVGGDEVLRTLVALDPGIGVTYFEGSIQLFDTGTESAAGKGRR